MGKGSTSGAADGSTQANPIVADDTERTVSNVAMVDIISEGPILGLVNGAQSIYFNQEQWQLPNGSFNLKGIGARFRNGLPEQEPLPYQWVEQTFDVNQPVKSAFNGVALVDNGGLDVGANVDVAQGLFLSNKVWTSASRPAGVEAIKLGQPGTGLKQTAVPTQGPVGGFTFNGSTYNAVILNPGANVIGDGNTTFFQSYYYNGGWQVGPGFEITGGVARTITNPNCRAVRVILKVDKLFQQSGNGDVKAAVLRFVIQYKLSTVANDTSTSYWHTCELLNVNWLPFPTYYFDVALPMYYPIRAPTGWNWGSILGLFGPQFNVARIKVEVAVRVAPRSRYTLRIQSKIMTDVGSGPDTRGPEEGWVSLTNSEPDLTYQPFQSGFNGSDSPQIMRLTLYSFSGINIAFYGLRVIDDFGNEVLDKIWKYSPGGPDYTSYGQGVGSIGDGVQGLYLKTQSGVQLDYIVKLPTRPALENPNHLDNVQLRVVRLTEDDIYQNIDAPAVLTAEGVGTDDSTTRAARWITYSSLTWAAYVELIEDTMQYADTALCGFELNSQWTGTSIPARAYDVYGRIIRVPSNYDAFTHTYDGIWDGTFVQSWTDNPVWIFLDLLTHDRYGLGNWITDDLIDFSSLYQVALYCDEAVTTDGDTTPCPRFTFNTQITAQDQAYNVLAMLSSVFRGMIYWAAGGITITQDSPKDPTRVVTPANVINGEFQYAGSALQARHSVVLVQWSDNANFGKDRTDVYEDPDLIERYGYVTTEMKAWGCTRFSQAMRMARWLLDTEKFSTEVVTYRAGFDHADARPGEIVAIADPTISGIRHGGRIVQGTSTTRIILDAPFAFHSTESYTLTIQIPTWGKVSVSAGDTTVVGNQTHFTNVTAPMFPHGFDTIVFAGQSKRYRTSPFTDTSIFLFEPYQGPDLVNADFTLFTDNFSFSGTEKFVLSSLSPIIEVPITNPNIITREITLTYPIPLPQENASFIITGSSVEPRLFTIVSNKEIDTHTYEISALAYDPTKFDRIEDV